MLPRVAQYSVVSASAPRGLQHTRSPCPSVSPRVGSNSSPLSPWYHPTVSSSIAPFSCLQSFPTSGSFPRSQLSASSGQSIGASASASVLQMNILPIWSFKWIYFLYGSNDRGLMMPFSWQTLQSFILKTCFVNLREHQVKQCWSLFIIDTWTKWTQLMKSEVDRNQVYNTYYSRVLHLGVHGFIFKRNGSH